MVLSHGVGSLTQNSGTNSPGFSGCNQPHPAPRWPPYVISGLVGPTWEGADLACSLWLLPVSSRLSGLILFPIH